MESSNKSRRASKYNEHFDQIKAPPEKVAEVVMKSPAKKKDDWNYLKNGLNQKC